MGLETSPESRRQLEPETKTQDLSTVEGSRNPVLKKQEAEIYARVMSGEISEREGSEIIQRLESEHANRSGEVNRKLNSLELPSANALTQGELSYAEQMYRDYHNGLRELYSLLRDTTIGAALTGRGREDLRTILTENYAGGPGIKTWRIDPRVLTEENFASSLEEIGYRAFAYSTLENPQRMAVDPKPGGVMVLQRTPSPLLSRNAGHNWTNPDLENPVGETTLSLEPRNFSEVVRGVIEHSKYADYHSTLSNPIDTLQETGPHQEGKIAGETPAARDQRIAKYNEAYERATLTKKVIGLHIMNEAFKLLQ